MKDLVAYLAQVLVDDPGSVQVHESQDGSTHRYELAVAPGEVGKIIGREGRTIKALRTIVAAVAQRTGSRAELDVLDGEGRPDRGPRREGHRHRDRHR